MQIMQAAMPLPLDEIRSADMLKWKFCSIFIGLHGMSGLAGALRLRCDTFPVAMHARL